MKQLKSFGVELGAWVRSEAGYIAAGAGQIGDEALIEADQKDGMVGVASRNAEAAAGLGAISTSILAPTISVASLRSCSGLPRA